MQVQCPLPSILSPYNTKYLAAGNDLNIYEQNFCRNITRAGHATILKHRGSTTRQSDMQEIVKPSLSKRIVITSWIETSQQATICWPYLIVTLSRQLCPTLVATNPRCQSIFDDLLFLLHPVFTSVSCIFLPLVHLFSFPLRLFVLYSICTFPFLATGTFVIPAPVCSTHCCTYCTVNVSFSSDCIHLLVCLAGCLYLYVPMLRVVRPTFPIALNYV